MSGEAIFYLIILFMIIAGYLLRNWYDAARVRKYILRLVQNKDVRYYDYHFMDCQKEQLLYPLTDKQQTLLRTCRKLTVTRADVLPLRTLSRLWGETHYHVQYDLSGNDAAGNPFAIQESGYLLVGIQHIRGTFWLTISTVKGSREPF